ncbi:hypothetical protein V2J09_007566 [Rumex salicifolius]
MMPPKPCCIDEIGSIWTDEQLILILQSIQNGYSEASLPNNVVADINPYLHEPSNLPEGIWFIVYSKDPKQAEVGIWKAKDDPCQIYTNSSFTGWRTTLEFYKGQSNNSRRTDWVMQDYSITDNICSNVKERRSLCRVFLSDGQSKTKATHDEPLKSKLHVEMERHQIMLPRQEGDTSIQSDYFEEGNFLEILDLENDLSSSSSGNSSCVSPSSDLCFDSVALLHELEDEVSSTNQSCYKFSASTPIDNVVTVAAKDSPIRSEIMTLATAKAGASNDAGASSSRQTPRGDKGKKVQRGKMMRKLLCFMA